MEHAPKEQPAILIVAEHRFHDLRHTAYTKLVEAGVPEGIMMALMGHVSPEHGRALLTRPHGRDEESGGAAQS